MRLSHRPQTRSLRGPNGHIVNINHLRAGRAPVDRCGALGGRGAAGGGDLGGAAGGGGRGAAGGGDGMEDPFMRRAMQEAVDTLRRAQVRVGVCVRVCGWIGRGRRAQQRLPAQIVLPWTTLSLPSPTQPSPFTNPLPPLTNPRQWPASRRAAN
jgi:hypothetical protein